MLDQIVSRLKQRDNNEPWTVSHHSKCAGVLIPLVKRPGKPGIILTKRSEFLSSHSGQVAFPGGKWDETDSHLLETALRETEEEIALPPRSVEVVAELPPLRSITDIHVLPYVGIVPPDLSYRPNPDEIDAIFEVPLDYFLDPGNQESYWFETHLGELEMPCYRYQGFVIWGFTLVILTGFLNYTLDAGLRLNYPPETIRLRGKEPEIYEQKF